MRTVHFAPKHDDARTALVRNAITNAARHGIVVTEVHDTFIVTAPQFGLVAACTTLKGVQDLIIRSAGKFPTDEQRMKYERYRRRHTMIVNLCERSKAFMKQHTRIFYDYKRGVACDHRIPWEYLSAMEGARKGA